MGEGLCPSLAFAGLQRLARRIAVQLGRDGGGDEEVELAGVVADAGGKARAGQHLVEGVSDVFELAVEVVAVVFEPILEALEEVAREVPVRRIRQARQASRIIFSYSILSCEENQIDAASGAFLVPRLDRSLAPLANMAGRGRGTPV